MSDGIGRRIGWFFVLGALLLVGHALMPKPRPVLVVSVGDRDPQAAIEEAVLLEQGYQAGWVHTDPVIRERLADNLRFVGIEGEQAALVEEAVRLGMHRTDHVVRARLRLRVEQLLDAPASPTEPDLQAYLEAHPERFARPHRLDLDHVFFSRDRRSDAAADAETAALALAEHPEDFAALGDPFVPLGGTVTVDLPTLEARVGPGFGEAALALPTGSWQGPLPSAFGLHLLRVRSVEPGLVPPLDSIRPQVAAEWRQDTRERVHAERIAQLIAHYDVQVVP